jgi:hypothetical protein
MRSHQNSGSRSSWIRDQLVCHLPAHAACGTGHHRDARWQLFGVHA